jgi:hypothetical protein
LSNAEFLIERDVTPPAPAAGRMTVYAKTDHGIYSLDPAGNEKQMNATMVAAPPKFRFGDETMYNTDQTFIQNKITCIASRLVPDSALCTAMAIFFLNDPIGSQTAILGIYDDDGTTFPSNLIATTDQFTVVDGWNVANLVTPVTLTAAPYWLAFNLSYFGNGPAGANTQGRLTKQVNQTFGAFPSAFPGSDPSLVGLNQCWSLYAVMTAV